MCPVVINDFEFCCAHVRVGVRASTSARARARVCVCVWQVCMVYVYAYMYVHAIKVHYWLTFQVKHAIHNGILGVTLLYPI